ncbi:MAG: hypothetical protein HKL80_09845 [Acidimicrobiales bacterium]|nr:hypothetical protein [Acidimicrobiales bacterium]
MMTQSSESTMEQQWYIETACVRGMFHDRNSLPLQDAILSFGDLYSKSGPLVLSVADGHGDIIHFRSASGSQMATRVALEVFQNHLADIKALEAKDLDLSAIEQFVRKNVVEEVVSKWKQHVMADLEANPFEDSEIEAMQTRPAINFEANPTIAYGTTLLSACIVGNLAIMIQIGDGDIVVLHSDKTVITPIPRDPFLVGGRTTSLCQKNPQKDFHAAVIDLRVRPIALILLASDGFGNSQVEPNWHHDVATDIATFSKNYGIEWVSQNLPLWAAQCASNDGSGDDTTLGLVLSNSIFDYIEEQT